MALLNSEDMGGGYTLDQIEGERKEIYYRACKRGMCRYAEDEYIARMYLEGMGWDPTQLDPPPTTK